MKGPRFLNKILNSVFFSVALYGLFGIFWIKLSDAILFMFVQDPVTLSRAQTYKGWFYIFITSLLFYLFIQKHRTYIAKQEEDQNKIFFNVPLPLLQINNEGYITLMNQAFTDTYGYVLDDFSSREEWFSKLYPNEDYRVMAKREWEKETAFHLNKEYISREFIVTDAWHKKRSVEFLVLHQKQGFVTICKDISQQKVREEEKMQENKMRALGELAGGIAHDFNNQLTGIMGFSDLLMQSTNRESPEFEYLRSIITASETSASLTAELLAYTRDRSEEYETVDMGRVLQETELLIQRTFPRQYVFNKKLETDSLLVSGNPSRLQSMLLNLVINAKDSMLEGGEIGIRVYSENRQAEQINGLPLKGGDYLVLEVKDQGSGISFSQLDRIFEPFYTTKEKGRGTGMGLAMVYSTLRIHLGSIEVESSPGEGSLFRVFLPLK